MIRRTILVMALTAVIAGGCGSGSSGADDDGIVGGGENVGDLGDAVEVMASAPARADAAACQVDRATLESAIEVYAALVGTPPASEDDLVGERLIREPSPLHDIAAGGTVVAAPASPCP